MRYLLLASALFLAGCATQNAMHLRNNMMQIDVSAAPVYGRAGAQRMAMQKAAQATLDAGFDKFIVVSTHSWNESGITGGSSGSFSANPSLASGTHQSGFSSYKRPESTLIIKMYRKGDPEFDKAVDAASVLNQQEKQ